MASCRAANGQHCIGPPQRKIPAKDGFERIHIAACREQARDRVCLDNMTSGVVCDRVTAWTLTLRVLGSECGTEVLALRSI
jgi:hypothetical protein